MFKHLIDRMDAVHLESEQLNQVFSVDVGGKLVTLEEYLVQKAPDVTLESLGIEQQPSVEDHGEIKPVRNLSEEEFMPVVEAYLNATPDNEVLEAVGEGSFTADQLRSEVANHTAVGTRIVHMIRQHNIFLEEAAKEGKLQIKEKEISLPAFDF